MSTKVTHRDSVLDYHAIMREVEAHKTERAKRMPTEQDAIRAMFEAYERLKELGWRDGRYAPTGKGRFAGICNGSTGIHAYTAEKPNSPFAPTLYNILDGDIWPTYTPPVLFREWRDTDIQPNLPPMCTGLVDEDAAAIRTQPQQGEGNEPVQQ